jgi:hypothetical protein
MSILSSEVSAALPEKASQVRLAVAALSREELREWINVEVHGHE